MYIHKLYGYEQFFVSLKSSKIMKILTLFNELVVEIKGLLWVLLV